jgi:hypothetical protein
LGVFVEIVWIVGYKLKNKDSKYFENSLRRWMKNDRNLRNFPSRREKPWQIFTRR